MTESALFVPQQVVCLITVPAVFPFTANMTVLLEQNKHILDQITTLSTLMMRLSSCIKFDRYRGYDSAEELNTVAQELAKNRDLYASEYM